MHCVVICSYVQNKMNTEATYLKMRSIPMNENVDEHTASHNNIFLLRRAVKGAKEFRRY